MPDTFEGLSDDVKEIKESLDDTGDIFDPAEKVLLKNFAKNYSDAVDEGKIDIEQQGDLLKEAFGDNETQKVLSFPLGKTWQNLRKEEGREWGVDGCENGAICQFYDALHGADYKNFGIDGKFGPVTEGEHERLRGLDRAEGISVYTDPEESDDENRDDAPQGPKPEKGHLITYEHGEDKEKKLEQWAAYNDDMERIKFLPLMPSLILGSQQYVIRMDDGETLRFGPGNAYVDSRQPERSGTWDRKDYPDTLAVMIGGDEDQQIIFSTDTEKNTFDVAVVDEATEADESDEISQGSLTLGQLVDSGDFIGKLTHYRSSEKVPEGIFANDKYTGQGLGFVLFQIYNQPSLGMNDEKYAAEAEALISLAPDDPLMYSYLLHKAVDGGGTHELVIKAVMEAAMENDMLFAVITDFATMDNTDLLSELREDMRDIDDEQKVFTAIIRNLLDDQYVEESQATGHFIVASSLESSVFRGMHKNNVLKSLLESHGFEHSVNGKWKEVEVVD